MAVAITRRDLSVGELRREAAGTRDGHRQLGGRLACEMGPRQVGGPDDDALCSQLRWPDTANKS